MLHGWETQTLDFNYKGLLFLKLFHVPVSWDNINRRPIPGLHFLKGLTIVGLIRVRMQHLYPIIQLL